MNSLCTILAFETFVEDAGVSLTGRVAQPAISNGMRTMLLLTFWQK
jgi:hypothetical protein